MRSPSPIAALVALVLVTGGCGLFDDDETTPAATTSIATTPATTTTTTGPEPEVLEAGVAPRERLRLRFTEGASTAVVLTLDLDVTQESAGTTQTLDSPVVTETVRFTVDRVDGDEADISFAFTEIGLDRAGTDLTDQEHLELTADLQDLVGLGGTGRLTNRGALTAFSYETPADLDPAVAATLDQFEDQFAIIALPLPGEALGVGGRWRSTTTTTLAGVTVDQVTTYEITDLTDTGVAYEATSEQSASSQDLDDAGLPSGTTARLVSSDVSGTGSGTMDRGSIVAKATSTLSGTQVVDISEGGGPPVRLIQRLDVVLAVKPAR